MKRASLLTIIVGLLLAFTVGATWAATLNPVQCSTNPCNGTAVADKIFGTSRADVINAGGGGDSVFGRASDDNMQGAGGNDTMTGEEGADVLRGSFGKDYMIGDEGNDRVYGGPDNDTMRGVGDNDRIYAANDASNRDDINCGTGTDVAYVDSNDVVDGVLADTLVVNTGLSCERLYVNGILIPTGP